MADPQSQIKVQVCYAGQERQALHELNVSVGTTLQQAIMQSGILQSVPEIDLTLSRVGIYGKLKSLDAVVRDHDRIEIYRPLIADPKESRRVRAGKKADAKLR